MSDKKDLGQPLSYPSREAWIEEGVRRFGEVKKMAFVCPVCGHIATVQEWHDAGGDEGVAFSCIGRWLDKKKSAFRSGGTEKGPCDYTGGGLLRFNPIEVTIDGEVHHVFAFAPELKS